MSKNGVAIVGARGYSGLELARLLLKHPKAHLAGCFATDATFSLHRYLPERQARQIATWDLGSFERHVEGLHTLFLATPAEVSLELAPKALANGVNVIDLSGAFRLSAGDAATRAKNYQTWYGFKHSEDAWLTRAEYGLVPWCGTPSITTAARLIANPGCYATSVTMALMPLLRAGALIPDSIVIDAKSGTSGGGRKATENLLFTEVDGECLPYKVGRHQHWPEIVQACSQIANVQIEPFFTTHLLPVRRGIISSIYAKLAPDFKAANDSETDQQITNVFHEAYASYPLVEFAALGTRDGEALLSLKRVTGSPRTQIAYRAQGDKLHLFSLIDNLVKGAAGQAVENFNRLIGKSASFGLDDVEGLL